jgi:PAS domain S-box-containing protein
MPMSTNSLETLPPHAGTDVRADAFPHHFLRLAEDVGDIGFWSADIGEDRIEATPGLLRMFGLPAGTGTTFVALAAMMHADDRRAHADLLALLRSGQPVQREFRIVRPDRTPRWVFSRAEVVLGPDDRPLHAVGVVRDVTWRHESVRSVEVGHDRFQALIASTAAVVWIASPDGRTLDMPQWEALTGQSRDNIQGLGWIDAVHPEDRARTTEAWRRAIQGEAPYNTDYRILCADGTYRWFNARGTPIAGADGYVREWVGLIVENPYDARPHGSDDDAAKRAELTPGQIRAARAFAGISAEELSRRSKVSTSTIRRMERDAWSIRSRPESLDSVRTALEAAGVTFTFDHACPPGVRPSG